MRYTSIPLPKKYTPHTLEEHPELRYAIKAIVNTLEYPKPLGEEWKTNVHYLYGLDLFNAGYYWEMHEVFEMLWRLTEKDSPTYFCFKGVIQLAISLLKHDRLEPKGRDTLFKNGSEYLRKSNADLFGIEIELLIAQISAYQKKESHAQPYILIIK